MKDFDKLSDAKRYSYHGDLGLSEDYSGQLIDMDDFLDLLYEYHKVKCRLDLLERFKAPLDPSQTM